MRLRGPFMPMSGRGRHRSGSIRQFFRPGPGEIGFVVSVDGKEFSLDFTADETARIKEVIDSDGGRRPVPSPAPSRGAR